MPVPPLLQVPLPWFFFVIKLRNAGSSVSTTLQQIPQHHFINNNFRFCFIFKFNNGRFLVGLELHIANFKHLFDQHITRFCFIFKFNNGRFLVGLELHIANFKHLFDQHITRFNFC
ncbi:hypothetical protein TCAL_16044 [Tigriopus californicus]|uniref:Uncharacterized protein n=1 Tax=Tigriopus californicus TaxID=6832 RepID=A0A553PNS0_TIGCA|nr:hypothetical protein TCAL_16044 [Tigriopus californicus]